MREKLPNLLSASRMAAAPVLAWALIGNRYDLAFPLVLAATLTDFADGWLARRWQVNSQAGAYLDPLADKVMLVVVYCAMGYSGAMPMWMVALVLCRDVMILAGAGVVRALKGRKQFPPTTWGKISTFYQMLLAGGVILYGVNPSLAPLPLMTMILGAAAMGTLWSGFDYLRIGVKMVRG